MSRQTSVKSDTCPERGVVDPTRISGKVSAKYPGSRNVYVRSEAAGRQAMAKLTSFLEGRLKLRINAAKSAVARPGERKFLGYGLTAQREPKLRIAASSIQRLKSRLREFMRAGRGRSLPP